MSSFVRHLTAVCLSTVGFSFMASAQIYHRPQSFNTYWAYCRSIGGPNAGQIVYNCPVQLEVQAYPNTNAHLHTAGQPRSSIHCASESQCSPRVGYLLNGNTTGRGSIQFDLAATLIGQDENVSVRAANGGQTMDYRVGYSDVYYNDHPEIWVRIGGTDTGANTGHGSTYYNRYMKSDPAYKFFYSTHWYLDVHPEISRVCANDMALPYGGKFDIGSTKWTSPHSQHDRGTAVDVAAVGTAQCANAGGSGVNVEEFRQTCINNGAVATASFNEGNHAHCGFESPTWPH